MKEAKKYVVDYVLFEDLELYFSLYNCFYSGEFEKLYHCEIYANSKNEAVKMFFIKFSNAIIIDVYTYEKINFLKTKFNALLGSNLRDELLTLQEIKEKQKQDIDNNIVRNLAISRQEEENGK